MADLKISALTASTTPLAGTEVLPIVQSSTTKQVSVANLTAGRNVSMSGGTVTSGGSIRSYRPDNAIYTDQYMAAGAGGGYIFNNANGDGFKWQYAGTDQFLIDSSGNFVPKVAGKGVNFTANTPQAGMTSQLLNWYEEGTWTPTLAASSGAITTSTITGTYTRTGNLVFVAIRVTIANNGTGLGSLNITGFPFAAKTATTISGATREDSLVGYGIVASPTSTTSINLTKYDGTYPGGSGVGFSLCLTYNM